MIETKFKNTEVGKIPADWDVTTIENITKKCSNAFVDGPFGSNLKTVHFVKNGDVYVIESSCVTTGTFIPKEYKTITTEHFETISRSECRPGDVIIAKIGMNCGMCGELPLLDKRSVVSGNSMKISLDQSKMLNYIFISYMNVAKKQGRFSGLISESAQPALSLKTLKPFLLALPTLAEQERIASALSDVDGLIMSLRQLIEKKRNIKTGVMKELLSGKKRLNGFSEEWKDVRLGSILKITTGSKDVNEGSINGKYPFFTCSTTVQKSNTYSFDQEAILVAGNGDVGNLHYYKGKFEAYQRTYVLYDFEVCSSYIWHYLNTFLMQKLNKDKVGSTIPYIVKRQLDDLIIKTPSTQKEQTAIAKVLSDMDAEIEQLEMRLTKYEDIKQGMMQQLLTGKIRLI